MARFNTIWNLLRLSVIARHHSVARARVGQVPALTARIHGFPSRKVTSIEMPVCSSRAERRLFAALSMRMSRRGRMQIILFCRFPQLRVLGFR